MNNITIYNIYSGSFYDILENHFDLLDDGQLPLNTKISCKKCYNRGYVGFSKTTYTYPPCRCVIKNIDKARYSKKFNIQSES